MTSERSTADGDADDPRYRRLPRGTLRLWQVENLVGALVAAVVVLAVFQAPFAGSDWRPWQSWALALVAAGTAVEALLVIPARYRSYRYAVLDHHVVVVRGKVFSRRYVFPLHQILYVESRQGPLLRRAGLVKVQLGTIAEPHSLGPVSERAADELRRAVEGPRPPGPPS